MANKLFFILAALAFCSQAMAREPYLNGGHFSALDSEMRQEEPALTVQAELGMSPADTAASKCDELVNGNDKTDDERHEKTGS